MLSGKWGQKTLPLSSLSSKATKSPKDKGGGSPASPGYDRRPNTRLADEKEERSGQRRAMPTHREEEWSWAEKSGAGESRLGGGSNHGCKGDGPVSKVPAKCKKTRRSVSRTRVKRAGVGRALRRWK